MPLSQAYMYAPSYIVHAMSLKRSVYNKTTQKDVRQTEPAAGGE